MSSFVYMKVLESQPRRYDTGLAVLSLGTVPRLKRRVVREHILAGTRMLDIGCGTGSLAVPAARAGAEVTGIDVSGPMLEVAREKVARARLEDRVTLREAGLSGLEEFENGSFDLVTITLVLSELSSDEQDYALREAHRLLRPGGRLVVVDEVRPQRWLPRLLYHLLRLPLAILAFLLTQTSTRAVEDPIGRVRRAGFLPHTVERTRLGSVLYLVATKG